MKFTCKKDNLVSTLSVVTKAVPIKHSFPLLTNVLIEAKDGRLKLAGTNLDTSIVVYIGASVEEEGSITVPARHLLEFVSHLSDEALSASLDKDIFHLHAGKTKSKFNGVIATDYPDLPSYAEDTLVLEISPSVFQKAINAVAFSVATDETRPVFSGIYLSYSSVEKTLTFVGSDGYRLSEYVIELEGGSEDFTVILPSKTLHEISRIFNSQDENIKIYLDNSTNLCLFQAGDILVSSRIIEGTYPDYRRIIPTTSTVTATFKSDALLEAVKLTSVFTKTGGNALRMHITPDGVIKVGSSSQEMGENTTEIPAVVTGDALEIVFNAKYLLDFLSASKLAELTFSANNASSPCLLKVSELENFLHVMAPMQLND